MSNIEIYFGHPLLLLLLIPGIALAVYPLFRLPKSVRFNKKRIISLALHITVVLIAILVLSGIKVYQSSDSSDIIIVADLSDSTTDSIDEINEYISELVEAADSDTNVGVVIFANGSLYASELGSDGDSVYDAYESYGEEVDDSATDISDALTYASTLFSDDVNKRIILISDGVETDGDAEDTAETLANSSIRIDTVYISSLDDTESEVQMESLVVPESIDAGDTIDVDVNIESNVDTTGTLQLLDNGEVVWEEEVDITSGTNQYSTEYEIDSSGLHSLSAVITADTDTSEDNNQVYSYVDASGSGSILIIDGTGDESADFADLLEDYYNVTVIDVDESEDYIDKLISYDEVILMNVSDSDLADGFDEALETYVDEYGGGVLTTGGENTYEYGAMTDTAFEDFLPIETEDDDSETVALVLVIDSSSSMEGTNLEMAKEGAINSVNALSDSDYISVITFNSSVTVVSDLTSVTNKDDVIEGIENITTSRGTYLYDALSEAYDQLEDIDADVKQVILLSDGNPQDSGYDNIVELMADDGIVTTTIAVGSQTNTDVMEELAEIGGGDFYDVTSASDLPDIMFEATVDSTGTYWNDVTFTPEIDTSTTDLKGIDELPSIDGYISVTAKTDATVVLETDDNEPVYAKWEYGNGNVGSLMISLSDEYSGELFSTEDGQQLLLNIVENLLPDSDSVSALSVSVDQDNYTSEVYITSSSDEEYSVIVTATDSDGNTQEVEASQTSDGSYKAEITTDVSGVYTIDVIAYNSDGVAADYTETYLAVSYSDEYDIFADTDGESLMYTISEITDGISSTSMDELLDVEVDIVEYEKDPTKGLLIAAMVIFITDIAVRKFKFKKKLK